MTNLLLRLFIKDYKNTGNSAVRAAIGKLAGMTGIVCNLLLAAGKLILGWIVGSVSIVADGANNLTDGASSVVTFLGFRMAQHPADKEHPYGHARYEYLSGLIVAVLILFVGVELAKTSFDKIFHPVGVPVSPAVLAILLGTAAVKLWMAGFFRTLGKRINSVTLLAAAADSRNDILATGAVLAGCLIQYFFQISIDGYVGLAMAVFILWSGISVVRSTVSPLLGQQADRTLVKNIEKLILSHAPVLGIHDLLVHDYGPGQCYASVHVELSAEEEPLRCHDIIDDIEWDALQELNVHLVIHYDPVVQNDEEQNEMQAIVQQILSDLDPRLSMHDFRLVRGATQKKLVFDLSVPYSMASSHSQIKANIDDALGDRDKAYLTVIRFDAEG
ncbi:MAG: cation transporter [Oscillospiraceae bacterium]|nr:cation transporter [Oscillospiraceae bacterium]